MYEPFRPSGQHGEKVVVFVRQNARSRTFNHGDILRKNEGVRTILLTRIFDYTFQREAFDEIHLYFSDADLRTKITRLARHYDLLAVIGSTQPARPTRTLIEMPRKWPVLINHYDSYWALSCFSEIDFAEIQDFTPLIPDIADEQFCFRHVDGIIARSGELQVLFKEHGIETPHLLLEDGCNPRYFQPLTPRSGPRRNEWSVVYAGVFFSMRSDSRVHSEAQFVPLGKHFAQERIHFHLYPSPLQEYQYPEYEAEVARNPYFHLHRSVDFDKVHREIGRYDFGWYALDFSKSSRLWTDDFHQYVLSTKFYTFLEAGLPVITNEAVARSARIVRQTGAGIVVAADAPRGLRAVIEQHDMAELIRGVARARAELDVNRRSGELLAFIKGVRERHERAQR